MSSNAVFGDRRKKGTELALERKIDTETQNCRHMMIQMSWSSLLQFQITGSIGQTHDSHPSDWTLIQPTLLPPRHFPPACQVIHQTPFIHISPRLCFPVSRLTPLSLCFRAFMLEISVPHFPCVSADTCIAQ